MSTVNDRLEPSMGLLASLVLDSGERWGACATDVQKADALVQRYRIDGVPSFVINGKYVADVRTAGNPERLMSLVGDLAAQEHKH